MFLRTNSKAFSGFNKSELFGPRTHNSICFGSHRASIAGGNYSYMLEFSQSYTFTQIDRPTNGWRGVSVNWSNAITAACKQYGISYLCYKFDGSGDSGDFDFEQMNTHDNLDLTFHDRSGMIDATDSSLDHIMRSRRWTGRGTAVGGVLGFVTLLEDIMSHKLAEEHGGWEINSGSFGQVEYENGVVTIEINDHTYECEVCEEIYNDDEPCSCNCCPDCGEKTQEMECEDCKIKFDNCSCGALKSSIEKQCFSCGWQERHDKEIAQKTEAVSQPENP
jgi:hypothetical protein